MASLLNNHRSFSKVLLAVLLAAPVVLWLLPSDFFETGNGIALCPSKAFFDFECMGCGMTRAVMHFHHFEFDDAAYYNMGVFIVYPALVALWGYWVWLLMKRLQIIRPAPSA